MKELEDFAHSRITHLIKSEFSRNLGTFSEKCNGKTISTQNTRQFNCLTLSKKSFYNFSDFFSSLKIKKYFFCKQIRQIYNFLTFSHIFCWKFLFDKFLSRFLRKNNFCARSQFPEAWSLHVSDTCTCDKFCTNRLKHKQIINKRFKFSVFLILRKSIQ